MKQLKTAYSLFVRAAHDAHRIPARTLKGAVNEYHSYIRLIWDGVREEHKADWERLAMRRTSLSDTELPIRGQRMLKQQGYLFSFMPHVEQLFQYDIFTSTHKTLYHFSDAELRLLEENMR